MIRVICLNPVVDRMYYISGFQAGRQFKEIAPQVYAGGKGVNTTRVISQLGERCCLYGFFGGSNGRFVEENMRHNGVELHPFYVEAETRTTINIIDHACGRETEITEPSVPIGPQEQAEFLEALEADLQADDLVVCSGIPMAGMEPSVYRSISEIAARRGARCALDANGRYLRASFPGNYCFAKPNAAELGELFDEQPDGSETQVQRLAKKMMGLGVERVLVSTGSTGGMLIRDGVCLRARVPELDVCSTIGSGDATVAGFCVALNNGWEDTQALRLAMACGVCNALFKEVGFVERSKVDELVDRIQVERI